MVGVRGQKRGLICKYSPSLSVFKGANIVSILCIYIIARHNYAT